MSLAPGMRLGVYEVVAPLGAGGMGEVYRARDTKLGRDVALKILPPAFAEDAERRARFEREARTLATLNHPHIAHVYGFEEASIGASATHALVMELVEGEDLSARIARGALPLDEALPIARQVAEALEAAHDAGIIHRDLKPANIKLRPDGTVKVLDFGLAKPGGAATADGGSGQLNSPTITTPALTMGGMILGTAAYMAPEQAKGKAVDKRADIWAFGCLFYEMLTGTRAFEGEDVSDTLAAVLRGQPEWTAVATLPRPVRILLERCIERDWRRRVGSMSTVRFVLDDPDVLTLTPTKPTHEARSRNRWFAVAAASLIALGLLAGYGYWRFAAPAAAPPVTRFEIPLPENQVLGIGRRLVGLSPDGQTLAYVTENQVFLRPFSQFESTPLAIAESGQSLTSPTFSPDGAWLAFHSGSEQAVKRVSLRGGAALKVCDAANALSIAWDATGILLGLGSRGVVRCNPAGGEAEEVLPVAEGEAFLGPQLLPGGDAMLVTVARQSEPDGTRWERASVIVASLTDRTRRTVVAEGSDAVFLAPGYLAYRVAGILYVVPFDGIAGEVRGEPTSAIEGIRRGTNGPTQMALSASGTLVYIAGPVSITASAYQLAIGERGGTVSRVALPPGPFVHVRATRDGRRLVIGSDDGNDANVWTYVLGSGGSLQRLTLEGQNRFPLWSPDGQWVAFQSDRGGDTGIYRQRSDGTGGAERLTSAADGETHIPESWSPDGRYLSYSVRTTARRATGTAARRPTHSLWVLTLADRKAVRFGTQTSFQPFGSNFSPDGRWIAYGFDPGEGTTASNRGVFVQPFPPTGAVYQAPRQLVDFHPMWSPDGRELVFLASATARQLAALPVSASGGFTFGTVTRFPSSVTGDKLSNEPRSFDLLPDGRLIGFVSPGEASVRTYRDFRVVTNWIEELKQRVPLPR